MEKTVILNTSYGKIRGLQLDDRQVFKGVRYATAKRFQKPQLYTSKDEIYDATSFGYTCPQPGQKEGSFYYREFWNYPGFQTPYNEDCLFLNIFKPDNAQNLPVAIWIHGGSFLNGFCHKIDIDGEYFNKQGVILVSINYRMGALGYLTSSILDQAYGESGNYGVYDQLAAIDWVHQHIASFGGDPNKITIMGQSAGAMSVQTILSSPLVNKAVCGAIMQSGGGINNKMNYSVSAKELAEVHDEYLRHIGITTLDQLLAIDPMELVWSAADYVREKRGGLIMYIPHMSSDILPDTYEKLALEGRLLNVPIMLGVTKDDITVGKEGVYESPVYKGCLELIEALNNCGHQPLYFYGFGQDPLGGEGQGCFHSSELWYTFHSLDRSWRPKQPADYEVADAMNTAWANFIKHGDPNTDNDWPAYANEKPFMRRFGKI